MQPTDLTDSDQKILDVLSEGRGTPAFLVDETNLASQTIHNRLNVLVAAGHVEKIHGSGLYELKNDPRQ